ncbi:hypothetical protein EOM60_00645 [Candidatus Saccharibacteria bacterium]|nr:hypothetical protein [Candidatus Saccharibacteria bacterium]
MKRFIFPVVAIVAMAITGIIASSPVGATRNSSSCLDPKNPRSFEASIKSRSSGTITTKDGRPLCSDAEMTLASMSVPDTWDRKGWNKTAIPQTLFADTKFTFPGGKSNHKMTITVNAVDECKNTQTDFYVAPSYQSITTLTGDDERNVVGVLFAGKKCEEPKPEPEPKKIDVCRLLDKKYPVTIDEKDFDSKKYSKDAKDCDKTPVTPEKPEEPKQPEQPAELPKTGAIGTIGGLFGIGSLTGATYSYIRSRRSI